MNWSKYNFLFISEQYGYLLYNSLTNSFVELDKEMYISLNKLKDNTISVTDFLSAEEIDQLTKAKILVESDYDEYLNIKLHKHLKRFDKSLMTLTIAPTLHCNFACSYCFEESRPNIYMTDDIENNLIKFINRHEEIKRLSITWFGGEPLMSFDRIKSITQRISLLGVNYYASIVTNGYLMSKEVIDCFVDLNIRKVHVTIDGPEEIHDKRRPHIKEIKSFEVIYKNLLYLKPYIRERKIALTVRVNVDHTNKKYYNEIYKKIRTDFENLNVDIYAGIVKKTYGSCSSIDDVLLDNQEQASFNIEQYSKYGITCSDFFPVRVGGECMARQIYGYLIDARGDIYKCWTDVGSTKEKVGNISNTDSVNTTKLTKYLTGADVFDKQKCQDCFFLPVCGGGCPHLALKKLSGDKNINLCLVAKENLKKFLEIYYEIKTNQKQMV